MHWGDFILGAVLMLCVAVWFAIAVDNKRKKSAKAEKESKEEPKKEEIKISTLDMLKQLFKEDNVNKEYPIFVNGKAYLLRGRYNMWQPFKTSDYYFEILINEQVVMLRNVSYKGTVKEWIAFNRDFDEDEVVNIIITAYNSIPKEKSKKSL